MQTTVKITVEQSPGGYAVHRNGTAMRTPKVRPLTAHTRALAEAIAEEWRAQTGKINPAMMPMNQLATTAIDVTRDQRATIIDQVVGYATSELLCHRAEQPPELAGKQQQAWQPILDWCALRFHAPLATGAGVMPITQLPETLKALRHAVETRDDFGLTGLKHAVETSASLVLGLALAEHHLTAAQAFDAAELDAQFQAQKWGDDPASVNRHEAIKRDLLICEKWFKLSGA